MNKITLFFLICTLPFYGQVVTVDDTTYSIQELIEDILIDSPCATVDNFSSFTGTAQGFNGIGYFESNSSGFEIERGVILSTGNALSAAGPNGATPLGEGQGTGWLGDTDLSSITGLAGLFNATYIEFEFVPSADFISFDFLFASEEYTGSFPCNFSDSFAFILTDSSGLPRNLAVVPGTTNPILVTSVHDGVDLNNDGDYIDVVNGFSECPPRNSEFFNRRIPAGTDAPIDFNGYTQVMTASGDVIPNERYTIKLVIADNTDGQYDSAVFLAAGSFNLGGDLGDDRTLSAGDPGCIGDPIVLDATLGIGSTYIWMKDNMPLAPEDGATLLDGGSKLEITQNGTYSVEIIISGGCIANDSVNVEFITSPDIVNQPLDLISCDIDDDGFNSFDLTSNSGLVLGTQDPLFFSITYHLSQEDAENYTGLSTDNHISNPSDYTNIAANQMIWLRIAEPNQECFKVASFMIEVIREPEANLPTNIEECDMNIEGSDIDGFTAFDLSVKKAEVLGSQNSENFSVLFYESQTEADAGVIGTELPDLFINTSNPQTIFARIENNTDRACYNTTTFQLIVNPLPVLLSDPVTLLQCDDDMDGFSLFNLSEVNSLISNNAANETFSYYVLEQDAVDGNTSGQIEDFMTYQNPIVGSSVVYARIESDKGCVRTAQVDLQVSTTQIPTDFNITLVGCESDIQDDNPSDGIMTFDISNTTDQILQLFPGSQNLSVHYYQNEEDALSEENEIIDIRNYRNTTSPLRQDLFVRVENDNNNACVGLGGHITLLVTPFTPIVFEEEYTLCLQRNGIAINLLPTDVIDTGLDSTENTFQWYMGTEVIIGNEIPGEVAAVFSPTVPGEYTVQVTNTVTGCSIARSTSVIESYPPENVTTEVITGAFSDNAMIRVIPQGIGEYEYRLDFGDWQSSDTFTGVSRGEHTIYVRDIRLCGERQTEVEYIVDYPRFFTPNGDVYNDTWGILGNENVRISGISIFDRHGKLLKDLGATGQWDGTYNGSLLPSSSYWFVVKYNEEGVDKVFKGSFSLIR